MRLGNAMSRKIHVGPAGEAVVPVPDAFSMPQKNELRHDIAVQMEWSTCQRRHHTSVGVPVVTARFRLIQDRDPVASRENGQAASNRVR